VRKASGSLEAHPEKEVSD